MKQPWSIDVDADLTLEVQRRREELGERFPRIALFVFGGAGAGELEATLRRVPEAATGWFTEAVIVREPDRELTEAAASALRDRLSERGLAVAFLRRPRKLGAGAGRKAAFEYALQRGVDFAVTLRGDGA